MSPAGAAGSQRGYVPLGIDLSSFPGFSEYEYTYSRVRVLSLTCYVVTSLTGSSNLGGGYALAPSYDLLQSIVTVPSPVTGAALVYRNILPSGFTVPSGQAFGIRVGENTYELNTSTAARVGTSNVAGVDTHTVTPNAAGGDPEYTRVVTQANGVNVVSPSIGVKPEGEVAAAGAQAEVPLAGTAQEYDLPQVSISQIQQLKRYRTIFPSTDKRRIKFRFVPYYFTTTNGPVGDLTLRALPRYSSSRRWMPIEWFSRAQGRSPMILFGPYILPLFLNEAPTEDVHVYLYYHIRLQFAGQV